ncbi:cytochrome c oxidase subunit II [Allosphingosinicella vermicomposti]|uniref:cytochrome c oxidase subunit II n=1 Tax=Allosphingosinicella vermicomposti TaxID=614671 RepID=UPI000D0FD263|nr:cytochrome c oxidase subunit II [Allosphingosinicella vermicomposti]
MTVEGLAGWPPPVFDPAGPFAGSITTLAWVLTGMAVAVLAIVLLAIWTALKGRPALRKRLGGERMIWIGGVAFPVVVLTLLLIWGLSLTSGISKPIAGTDMRIRVSGEMWWWRVSYLDGQGREILRDANEIHIPAGQTVALELTSADVIHSFWVPRLSGKLDMIPGRTNVMRIQADKPGVYGGQCAEYCGGPHALMGFVVVAHTPEDFGRWMASRQAPPPAPATNEARRGAALFASAGCAACHAVAGTSANGLAGPDLSYVGARRTLGAGILPNNRGAMIGWIGNSQAIKPANRMPAYTMLPAEDLKAIAVYLEGLK